MKYSSVFQLILWAERASKRRCSPARWLMAPFDIGLALALAALLFLVRDCVLTFVRAGVLVALMGLVASESIRR